METRFKVGDRVRHEEHGDGMVCDVVGKQCLICFTEATDVRKVGWVKRRELTIISHALSPDRAMIAAMAMQGLFAKEQFNVEQAHLVASVAVKYADALIAELQKPKP